jgi:hypothetical protein
MRYCEKCSDDLTIRSYCHTCYSQLQDENKRLREALSTTIGWIDAFGSRPKCNDVLEVARSALDGNLSGTV